jgi:ABC-type transporter Mla subunit MlaD
LGAGGLRSSLLADGARRRREAIRQLADLYRRLAAAEDTLADALAAMKSAEGAFDAASDRFDAAEHAVDAAREGRAQGLAGPVRRPASLRAGQNHRRTPHPAGA